jgi:hypothetical protein
LFLIILWQHSAKNNPHIQLDLLQVCLHMANLPPYLLYTRPLTNEHLGHDSELTHDIKKRRNWG